MKKPPKVVYVMQHAKTGEVEDVATTSLDFRECMIANKAWAIPIVVRRYVLAPAAKKGVRK